MELINLYSIRYPHSKKNPRVIYFVFGEDEAIILVTAFKEKSSKDYQKGIERAAGRYKALM